MATKIEHVGLETAHFNNFVKFIPGIECMDEGTVRQLLALGLMQVSTAFEHAIANVAGARVTSTDAADLSDGSDAKLSTVRTYCKGKSYSAPVSNVKGKTGDLRVQVYERKQGRFFYFVVPNSAYRGLPVKSNIEIPFDLDGTPRRIPRREVNENWWNYEVDTFEEMCTRKARYLNAAVTAKTQARDRAERG
jgi:hypothetical protein